MDLQGSSWTYIVPSGLRVIVVMFAVKSTQQIACSLWHDEGQYHLKTSIRTRYVLSSDLFAVSVRLLLHEGR